VIWGQVYLMDPETPSPKNEFPLAVATHL